MPITPWRSLWDSEFLSLKAEMDRIFDEFFGRPIFPLAEEAGWSFAVDVLQTKRDIVVYADLPGVNPKDVLITVSENRLTIRGERGREVERETEEVFRSERFHGEFERTIPLPTEVDAERATASYKDGVLKIVIPKVEKTFPREIKIEIE